MKRGPSSEPCSCRSGCDCGCCAGIEPLTPLSIANRPGLPALVYRAGTWSSFFETMEARLTSADLPALLGLTTRETSDPAIALLDAWAVLANVLTFYQERIANEGYLRTATERRSVLELARLVGYTLRPGVASSVYLAYTIEEKPKPVPAPAMPGSPVAPASASVEEPEILIPKGSRAQSVPGPGELPQPFETSDDLIARAAWNRFQVRLTRPQLPDKILNATVWPVPLDFQGIATQLKPNDPLLIDTGLREGPHLFRVMGVAADAAQGRTRVQVQHWWTRPPFVIELTTASVPAPTPVPVPVPIQIEAVKTLVTRASDLETAGVARGATVSRVLSQVEAMGTAVDANVEDAEDADLRAQIEATLANLRQELDNAQKTNATRLTPWIGQLVADLEAVLADVGATEPPAAAARFAPTASAGFTTGDNPPPTTTRIGDVLGSLGKPTREQPRNAQRLPRDLQTLFAPGADLPAKLLTLEQPELAAGLYAAWANTPVTEAPVLSACALRTRASVFGHNAPRKLVPNEDRVILNSKEWDLFLEVVGIHTTLVPSNGSSQAVHLITLDDASDQATGSQPLSDGKVTLHFERTTETVTIEIAYLASSLPQLMITYTFEQHHCSIQVKVKQEKADVVVQGLFPNIVTSAVFPSNQGTQVVVSVAQPTEEARVVWLDASYPQILPGGWLALERPTPLATAPGGPRPLVIARVAAVSERSRAEYGISAKSTRVELDRDWLDLAHDTFAVIRGTAVYAQCENLPLAEEPIPDPVCGDTHELTGLYDGLTPGRWLIVSGERADVGQTDDQGKVVVPVAGVPAAELVMLAGVAQGVAQQAFDGDFEDRPGERTHTTLTLAEPLAYCYKRDTVTIYGNVAHATHGETKAEVLGSGDGTKVRQSFTLRQPPLTWISAPTSSGVLSTLQVRVNDLLWHEAGCLAALGPTDRSYLTRTDDAGATTVVFGDGARGARLPTGTANVRARYRAGIGRPGNLKAGQISQLVTRPLGVKEVVNPLAATGGADPESRDQARRNAPLAVMALDRLVSVEDYADFARTFAGVGKASAARLVDRRSRGGRVVHVTIAGEDDIPILETSDLFVNLGLALRRFGDPRQPVEVALRDRRLLTLSAGVKILPDYEWETVEPRIRAALLYAFGYPRRDLGQPAFLSEVASAIQGVRGVDYADIDVFDWVAGSVDPQKLVDQLERLSEDQPKNFVAADLAQVDPQGARQPAQLVYLSPDVPDTLLLKEKKA